MWTEIWWTLAGRLSRCWVNLAGFLLDGPGQEKGQTGRVAHLRKALFLPAVLGGSLGSIVGMRTFRHKTKHWYSDTGCPPC
mgnify:CR=1 FL=1